MSQETRGPEILVRPMADGDLPAVVELLNEALGAAPGGADRGALFEWKHLRNPAGRSVALVAEMGGDLVGLRSFMRWRLLAPDDTQVLAVRAVDTATSPKIQRRGVFSRLTKEALELCAGEGVAFVFNTPNDKSRPGYIKMGWQVVTTWPMWLKVRRPTRLATAALRRDLRSGPAAPVPEGALAPFADLVSPMVDELAGGFAVPRGRLRTSRTADYLRWRYAEGPIPYHGLLASGDEGSALVVLRLRTRGRLREAVVCEALATPGAERLLASALRNAPRLAEADHAVVHAGPGWPARSVLGRAGYRRLPRAGMTFTVKPVGDVPAGRSWDPLAADAWSLTLGDLELF